MAKRTTKNISLILIFVTAALTVSALSNSNTYYSKVFASTDKDTDSSSGKSYADYISTIRTLLNQTVDVYQINDTAKSKELATTAYLDNFEYLEKPVGKELAEKGEGLMREQLIEQIKNKESIDKVKQTIDEINNVLNEIGTKLKA